MSEMKMSDVKELFFKKNIGCLTEDDISSGNYSEQDVIDLLNGYESLLAAFSRYAGNHDRLTEENQKLREALRDIQNMCIGEIAMGYKLSAESIGQMITEATGMTNPELNKLLEKTK